MSFEFRPYSLRGAAALPAGGFGLAGARRSVRSEVTIVANSPGRPPAARTVPSADLVLYGPGDVVGIDPGQIVRRSPRPFERQQEPNYLATIEFGDPALPWLFSPTEVRPGAPMPWLMLVVVRDTGPQTVRTVAGAPSLVLNVDSSQLPDPAQAWAWAHVQRHAGTVRSRLLSPARLKPGTDYVACVVPVFEAGRLAGLGLPAGDAPATTWAHAGAVTLPVYEHWRFHTGPFGDFELLAQLLHPVENLGELGKRVVAVDAAAGRLQPPEDAPLFPSGVQHVATAIAQDPGAGSLAIDRADDPQAAGLRPRLKKLVDITAGAAAAPEPIVGPPLYGQWHADATSLDGDPADPAVVVPGALDPKAWITELNANPHERIAAGTATRVVQRDQEALMADAWSQLESVLAANRRIRWTQLFEAVGEKLHARLDALPDARALRVANAALGRLRVADGIEPTLAASVAGSNVPAEILGATFVRTARYASRAAGPEQPPKTLAVQAAVAGLREGSDGFVASRFVTAPQVVPERVAAAVELAGVANEVSALAGRGVRAHVDLLERSHELVAERAEQLAASDDLPGDGTMPWQRGLVLDFRADDALAEHIQRAAVFAVQFMPGGGILAAPTPLQRDVAGVADGSFRSLAVTSVAAINATIVENGGEPELLIDLGAPGLVFVVARITRVDMVQASTLAGMTNETAQIERSAQTLRVSVLTTFGVAEELTPPVLATFAPIDRERFAADAVNVHAELIAPGEPRALPPIGRLTTEIRDTALAALRPEPNYRRMLVWAHASGPALAGPLPQRTPIHPIMAAPVFSSPIVERLKAFDQEWVLGGAGKLEPNSICVLSVNRPFVESFLVGANHEIARELRWRGYPTDLKGSCFRRFWPTRDPAGGAPPDDIEAIHTWDEPLGRNEPAGAPEELTMIVIKGDLLRRYPDTIVAVEFGAVSADRGEFTSERTVGESFRGNLDPDITYCAIPMATSALRATAGAKHWYVSLRQPHDEPRFGLDEFSSPDPNAVAPPNGPDPDDWTWQGFGDPPLLSPAQAGAGTSANVAANLHQRPFLVLLHAPDYLPQP